MASVEVLLVGVDVTEPDTVELTAGVLAGCLLCLLALPDVTMLLRALMFDVAGSFDGTKTVDIIVLVGDEATRVVTSRD